LKRDSPETAPREASSCVGNCRGERGVVERGVGEIESLEHREWEKQVQAWK
jgi:hypothetical protein